MGINFRKRVLVGEKVIKVCKDCKIAYEEGIEFCTNCGKKLKVQKAQMYINFGKHGISSFSYKMANGITINSKRGTTIPLGNGISYTLK